MKKNVSMVFKIWFFVLVILFTSVTAVQTSQYYELKLHDLEILFELNETNMTGYIESVELEKTFRFASYVQPDLFENYRYELHKVRTSMTLIVKIDNIFIFRATIHPNETYIFTVFKNFTPSQLEMDVSSRIPEESLHFNLRIIQLSNSQELAKFVIEFFEFIISEIFVIVILINWQKENSWLRNRSIQGLTNSILTILLLRLVS